ncbi:hypothetical protein WMY93_029733 [Mugilogobius chulae]|uniref:Uncharacterized protein n=1 Tax=Mugilogobius chulae TaxID=88201 RepID=A0AAW0MTL2_9GOBI
MRSSPGSTCRTQSTGDGQAGRGPRATQMAYRGRGERFLMCRQQASVSIATSTSPTAQTSCSGEAEREREIWHSSHIFTSFVHAFNGLCYELDMLAAIANDFEWSFKGGYNNCTLGARGDAAMKLDAARLSCQGRYLPQVVHSSSS